MQGNQESNGFAKINLKGLAVGNGLTDPAIQYKYYAQMANNNTYGGTLCIDLELPPYSDSTYATGVVKSVSDKAYKQMVEDTPGCIALINECQKNSSKCTEAQGTCNGENFMPLCTLLVGSHLMLFG